MRLGIVFLLGMCRLLGTDVAAQPWEAQRARMVSTQIASRDIDDPAVLDAMRTVPRHLFVPESIRTFAYENRPLPIGAGQTISQPYIVALMTQLLEVTGDMHVLEVGTGSGYQAAVLGEIVDSVFTIEIVPALAKAASSLLDSLGYTNIVVRAGDGYAGWPSKQPFDAVIVTAAPEKVPPPLLDQLAEGGRLVIPVGPRNWTQYLTLIEKRDGTIHERRIIPVRFVPFTRD
jgi:protein-L-isoaspartate(D-aspartate) O-methyltransferase